MSTNHPDEDTPTPPRRTTFHVANHGDIDFEQRELERLLMSMGFPTIDELLVIVSAVFVHQAFAEFVENHLATAAAGGSYDIPALDTIINYIVTDSITNEGRYTTANPNMTDWETSDYWARFIQQVYVAAQASNSSWAGVEEDDFALVAWQLFELLLILTRRWMAV
jgi:hypothetical protein